MNDSTTTIAAISTPPAMGGIGVVRLSGSRARELGQQVFHSISGKRLDAVPGYTALFGRVFDQEGEFDEAVVTVFKAPHSYTGEDVVELSCHGGLYILRRVLRALYGLGALPAGPGEFTQRAFLNGKMGLTQAESVMDLISAQGGQAARCALATHDGALFDKITQIRKGLVETAAHLAAWSDFPEDETPEITGVDLAEALDVAGAGLHTLLSTFDSGRILREGVETAIIGRPNVGKSTLMNLLAGVQRSIVTEIPGTTRDVVEEMVNLGDITLRLADTAGLRDTEDIVESVGVERARNRLKTAELVLAVFDSSDELDEEDYQLIEQLHGRPAVAVVNKSDLERRIDLDFLQKGMEHMVLVSAGQGHGLDELEQAIKKVLGLYQFDGGSAVLANERQRNCAQRALQAVLEGRAALASAYTFDAVGVCVDDAIAALLELTGESVSDTVIHEVFSHFCVGK